MGNPGRGSPASAAVRWPVRVRQCPGPSRDWADAPGDSLGNRGSTGTRGTGSRSTALRLPLSGGRSPSGEGQALRPPDLERPRPAVMCRAPCHTREGRPPLGNWVSPLSHARVGAHVADTGHCSVGGASEKEAQRDRRAAPSLPGRTPAAAAACSGASHCLSRASPHPVPGSFLPARHFQGQLRRGRWRQSG